MIKVTPLRIVIDPPIVEGTGRFKGQEILPTTPYLLNKLGINNTPDLNTIKPVEMDEDFLERHKLLRPYQLEDVSILANRAVGLILSEPRTGKTPTAISVFKEKGLKKYLVICPTSIIYQWKDEIEKWHGIKAEVVGTTPKRRQKQYENWTDSVLIMGFERFRIDFEKILKANKDIEGIIIDEAHRFKNHKSKTYYAIKHLKDVPNKLMLSGTLAPNKPYEVYTVFNVAFPTIFTSYYRFIDYYFETESVMNWGTKQEYQEIRGPKNTHELPQFLERVSIQHKQKEVMKWLPPKDYVKIKLPVTAKQAKYIKELEDVFETEHVIVENILTQLIRIRQVCQDPGILDLEGKSPKTEWIKEYIKDYPDKPIVIFSNFTGYLERLSEELNIPHIISGKVSAARKDILKNAFQTGKINVLLINIVAGKEGLTLDRAEAAIFCDNYPPAADITQAENRITATTEARSGKENTIYQLMMQDTYDEELYNLVETNTEANEIVNNYKKYLGGRKK